MFSFDNFNLLTNYRPIFPFYTSRKHHRTCEFVMFSGGIRRKDFPGFVMFSGGIRRKGFSEMD